MRGQIAYQEAHCNLRIKVVLVFEIIANIKRQSIDSGFQGGAAGQQLRDTAIIVRDAFTRSYKLSAGRHMLGSHPDSLCRSTPRRIEDVRADPAHAVSSLSNRKRMILFCSSAAARISCSGVFGRRDRKIASISWAVFPVAQTMKM